ncbi:hypothetical protein Hanom_Chr12g01066871 [Helianthus anomalus]
MNLLNQPLSWHPNQYGWNLKFNMGGYSLSQSSGSSQNEPDFVLETQTETQPDEEEPEAQTNTPPNQTKQNKQVSNKKKETTEIQTKKTVQPWYDEEVYALARAWDDVSKDPDICKIFIDFFIF